MKPEPQHCISPTVEQAPLIPHGFTGGWPGVGVAETAATRATRPRMMERIMFESVELVLFDCEVIGMQGDAVDELA